MVEGGVTSHKDKISKVALVYRQMNVPLGTHASVALTGLTVAKYFRDQEGQDVLLFIDPALPPPSLTSEGSDGILPGYANSLGDRWEIVVIFLTVIGQNSSILTII